MRRASPRNPRRLRGSPPFRRRRRAVAAAADRAKRAGIDAVELHAGHGYLIHSFLNPSVNTRDDRWGGSLENRARLLVEVIRAVKARCGDDYPVWCRIDGVEFMTEGGITHEDACSAAQLAEAAGADAIHVSAYADASRGESFTVAHAVHKPAGFVSYAAGIKAAVGIPVITAGRIDPELADDLIRRGSIFQSTSELVFPTGEFYQN